MKTTLDMVTAQLRQLDDAGSRILDDGTMLIRKLPARADGWFSEAYSHEIYAGLTDELIDRLEAGIHLKLPPDLRSFYHQANGLCLFSDSLSIKGLRENYRRHTSVRLPVSLEYGNVIDRPNGTVPGEVRQVRFGFFSDDPGAEVAMNLDGDRRVYAYPRYEPGPVLYHWPDLQTFLSSEVERMIMAFKARKGDVDPLNPVEPPWR